MTIVRQGRKGQVSSIVNSSEVAALIPAGQHRSNTEFPQSAQRRSNQTKRVREDRAHGHRACRSGVGLTDPSYAAEEWEFIQAIERYKKSTGRKFPSWREVLALLKEMGYRRVAEPRP